MKIIKGFALVPPVLGAIRIGKSIVKGDRRLPQKDDAFTITTQVQDKNGWVVHRLHDKVKAIQPPNQNGAEQKIRSIPVRLAFDDLDLSLRGEYSVFDQQTGRPICTGDGETARRRTANGVETMECPGAENCPFGREKRCKLYSRMSFQIDGQDDDFGVFIFRTTGFNSLRTVAARLSYLQALTGGPLAGIPLTLRLRAKTSSNSYRSVLYFVDILVREGMTLVEAIEAGKAAREVWANAGFSRAAFENAVRDGLARSPFIESEDDGVELLDDFIEPASHEVTAQSNKSAMMVDEDGVILDCPDGVGMQAKNNGGLAGLRSVIDRGDDIDGIPSPATEKNWHVPIL